MTYRELVYMVLDVLKIHSDDAKFTEDHVIFLLTKYRAYALKQTYAKAGKNIAHENYQTLLMTLSETVLPNNTCGLGEYLISNEKIPSIIEVGNPKVYPVNYFNGEISFVPKERMKYVGHNRFLPNIIYCSINTNDHMYFKSANPQFSMLEQAELYAVFEDPEDVYKTEDDYNGILDKDFPLEYALIPSVAELVIKDLTNGLYKPSDNSNDAQDALSDLAGFLRRNMKSQFQKQIDE